MRTTTLGLVLLASTSLLGCKKSGPDGLGTRYDADPSAAGDRQVTSFSEEAPRSTANKGRGGWDAGGQIGTQAGSTPEGEAWDAAPSDDRIAAEVSPGLGTAYGETRHSSIETVGFRRADPSSPDVVFTVRYDDVDGVRAAAAHRRDRAWSDDALQQHGGLAFALLDARGEVLPAATIGGELWAVGQPDARYSLAIANDTGSAFEVVASVDGLDVIDGRPAAFGKRGYIVDPFSSVVIDGWRTSEETVAAFRFSPIEDSYAERMGDGRNVGVIGAAFFREAPPSRDSWDRWTPPDDGWRRETADPFPGR